MANKFHEIAFSDAVKAVQERYGTRRHYEKLESRADYNDKIGDAETDFIESRDGFYLGTANDDGQPYIQFRGGRPGFLKVLDDRTLGFADFRGNLQYISVGNASANAKVALFLMDYPSRSRLKILGEIEFHEAADRPDLIEKLADPSYEAKVERAATIHVKGLEWNCPQHIMPRYTMDEVKVMIQPLYEHIESLESELAKIKGNQMKKYLDASMAFGEYEGLIERLVDEGKTTGPNQSEALTSFTKLNLQRMSRLQKTIEIGEDVRSVVRSVERKQVWLVITEGWCGDAAQNIPIIEKIAAENDSIETRYILRDENPELIDRFLTFGARSIPKVIALDAGSLEVLWTWGARPKAAYDLFFNLREQGVEKSAIMEQLQRWYNEDKGRSIQAEFASLLTGKDGRTAAVSAS